MKKEILAQLEEIQAEKNIRIFYACEAGSRAWGFPSVDSDYDVRILYAHPVEWYLSIDRKRDVIEMPISGDLDITGWELRKTLNLFRKSNGPLFEWLGSPIVYVEKFSVAEQLRALRPEYFSSTACVHHYLNMARRNKDYLQGNQINLKKLFYILRPALAVMWIEKGFGVVPTEFSTLVERMIDSPNLKGDITKLIELKRNSKEADYGPLLTSVLDFTERELNRMMQSNIVSDKPVASLEKLNQLFRNALEEIWCQGKMF
ncbi:MAG: nucleotidyltransferase domain-containing protein [Anaerolineales bacterium]|nr:nucleotidyltransferase domain-containing protein [Anaerolineales bacterium]